MSKTKKRVTGYSPERAQSSGFALAALHLKIKALNPRDHIMVKSFTLKYDGWDFLLVLRGNDHLDGVVQFKRVEELDKIGSIITTMLDSGEWKTDKYG